MKFLPKINAFEFTTIAFVIGIVLCDDLTPAEQNSVGNFFMLVGQVLSTNASQQQVINNYNKTSSSSNTHIVGDETRIDSIKKAVNIINENLSKY